MSDTQQNLANQNLYKQSSSWKTMYMHDLTLKKLKWMTTKYKILTA